MSTLHLLLRRPLLPLTLGITTFSTAYALQTLYRPRPLLCESPPTGATSSSFRIYTTNAETPLIKPNERRVNTAVYKQISSGSILGLLAGLGVSVFSRGLAFLIGVLVLGVQAAASRGINIVPTTRIQQYFRGVDVRSALQDNVAFKLSFGVTFMLAAFAEF
ncbi:MAG: hypothetical protein MMC33_001289 [Icmadophila ericetorum]|nr:hypothetical protein [Icmadophila ericetorum]